MSRNRLIIVSGHLGLPYKPGARNWANCSGISQVWLFWRNCALKQVGDPEHIKVFATTDAAETRFEENEGAAFEYEVLNELDWPVFRN